METKAPQIIYYTSEFGPLTHVELCQLTGMHPNSLWRSLPKLVSEGSLYCKKQGWGRPNVYATYDIRKRQSYTLEHDIARARVGAALKATNLLTYWRIVRHKQPKEKSVNEDGRFELSVEVNDKVASFSYWLEVDTGTEGYGQLEDKFERYMLLFEKEHGQALFVVKPDPEKPKRTDPATLAALAEKYIQYTKPDTHKKLLFVDLNELGANPLGPIVYTAHSTERCHLLPQELLNLIQ